MTKSAHFLDPMKPTDRTCLEARANIFIKTPKFTNYA